MRRAAPLKKNQMWTGGNRPGRGNGRVKVAAEEPKVKVEVAAEPVKVAVEPVKVAVEPVKVEVAAEPVKVAVEPVKVAVEPVSVLEPLESITTIPACVVFVSHCDLSDVMTPMPYILDFIQKYRHRYGENTTSFFLSTDSRHKASIQELYHEYVDYMPLLPYDHTLHKNPYFTEEEQECRIYCWRRHFPSHTTSNSSPLPPCNSLSSDFVEFFQQIFKLFKIGMSRNLGRYLPSLQSTLPGQEKMKRVRNLLLLANPLQLPVVFYLNSDDDEALTSTSTTLSKGTATHVHTFFQKLSHVFWIVSHKNPSIPHGSRDNLVFLADLLQLPQDQPFTVADIQAVSVLSRLTLTGMLSGIALLTRLQENTSKTLFVVPSETNIHLFLQEAHPAMGDIHLLSSDPHEAAEEIGKFF